MDQVFIRDLVARGIIGVNDWEREKPQEILINVILFADLSKAGVSDDIKDCVNYRTVAKKVQAHAESARDSRSKPWHQILQASVSKSREYKKHECGWKNPAPAALHAQWG